MIEICETNGCDYRSEIVSKMTDKAHPSKGTKYYLCGECADRWLKIYNTAYSCLFLIGFLGD